MAGAPPDSAAPGTGVDGQAACCPVARGCPARPVPAGPHPEGRCRAAPGNALPDHRGSPDGIDTRDGEQWALAIWPLPAHPGRAGAGVSVHHAVLLGHRGRLAGPDWTLALALLVSEPSLGSRGPLPGRAKAAP